jgi:hypothetical protein
MLAAEADSTLFFKFAEGGVHQVGVARITPASWERPLSRPGILFSLRAPDEQDGLPRLARTHDGYRRFWFCHVYILNKGGYRNSNRSMRALWWDQRWDEPWLGDNATLHVADPD